jgi:hypothetical protein
LAGEAAVEQNVSRSLQVGVADGAAAAVLLQNPLTEQIRAALDAPFNQQPREEFDPMRGGVAPDKGGVLVADAAVGNNAASPDFTSYTHLFARSIITINKISCSKFLNLGDTNALNAKQFETIKTDHQIFGKT